jgi:hypothetical protein
LLNLAPDDASGSDDDDDDDDYQCDGVENNSVRDVNGHGQLSRPNRQSSFAFSDIGLDDMTNNSTIDEMMHAIAVLASDPSGSILEEGSLHLDVSNTSMAERNQDDEPEIMKDDSQAVNTGSKDLRQKLARSASAITTLSDFSPLAYDQHLPKNRELSASEKQ